MNHPQITYVATPSFEGGIRVEMQWNPVLAHYDVDVQEGWSRRRSGVALAEVQGLLAAVNGLRLPAQARSTVGVDGTTFDLVLGQLRYTWWAELPAEWRALEPIVKAIERLAGVDGKSPPPMCGEPPRTGAR